MEAFIHNGVEAGVLFDENLAKLAVLAEEDGLEADKFEQGQEHGNEGALGAGVALMLLHCASLRFQPPPSA